MGERCAAAGGALARWRWLALPASIAALAAAPAAAAPLSFEARSLSGAQNNLAHPSWGEAGQPYARILPPRYADGAGAMEAGPNPRYVSNRVFNATGLDLFSERNVSQWGWVWGQFLDHTFGRAEPGREDASIPFAASDPLEGFENTLETIPAARDAVVPGTGTGAGNPRLQRNTVNSYIDGWALYGGSAERLEWMRTGPDDGNSSHAGATLLLSKKYLPLAGARGAAHPAPAMQTEGALAVKPQNAVVAGDVRANENADLTAVTTLFAREHNRIVAALPTSLSNEERFEIARRIVGAEQQYITYQEFLPAMGVTLSPYGGYDPNVDPQLSDEFATVGYRAHSMVNGEQHIEAPAAKYNSKIPALRELGLEVRPSPTHGSKVIVTISQGAAFFNPAVVPAVGLGPILEGLATEPGYKNDEQIDDALRSILFGIPRAGANPAFCYENPRQPECFSVVVDLGAIDIQRERDNGMPTYEQLREALGLAPQSTFTEVTGETTEAFPTNDPLVPASDAIDAPHILDFTSIANYFGEPLGTGSGGGTSSRKAKTSAPQRAVYATRRTTLAARLKAIYGSVSSLDPLVGMMSEPHLPGSELGELQSALWRKQFEALRDGDRFFYQHDPVVGELEARYGISYRHSLRELITLDAAVSAKKLPANVFLSPAPVAPTAARRR
ncbi:MAG: peroxidase [Solirubrobacteraceae bacterium]|nr:peroxidase [Solirubrobacteraceae bacterium]